MDKSEGTYDLLFNHVRILVNDIDPASMNMDYERAAINSANTVFAGSEVSGCFFHLSQNIYKRVQNNGLVNMYRDDENFRTNVKMIGAIAFVPLADVVDTFELLADHVGQEEQVILDYFETNYIGEMRRGRRRPPLFEHGLWSVHDRVLNDLPRTTNAVEGWHNAFAMALGQSHANIWTFLDRIKREEALARLAITQLNAGYPPPVQKRIYRQINEQLSNIVVDYENCARLDYLRGISYSI